MLIVILSTTATRTRKYMLEKEKSIKKYIIFFVFDRVRTCDLMVLIEISLDPSAISAH